MKKTLFAFCVILLAAVSVSFSVEDQIKPGNVINITVLRYPELSKSVVVRQDGTTDYPLLANIPINGLTTSELRELLSPILMRYVERPYLFISVMDYLKLKVKVLGEVKNPGTIMVDGPIDVQGILSEAGGPQQDADLRKIKIIRAQKGIKTEILVNMYDFFQPDQTYSELPEIADGDVIIVPMLTVDSYVRIYGCVANPGMYLPKIDSNVLDIINMAGGIRVPGNINNVSFITVGAGGIKGTRLKIGKMIERGLQQDIPIISSGDIIVVHEMSDWQRFSWWIWIFRDAVYLASSLIVLNRILVE